MRTETVRDVIKLFDNAETIIAYHDLLCGDLIAEGCSRIVYECAYDDTCVVKISKNINRLSSDNVLEWEIWGMICHMTNDVPKWFAPCIKISDNGRILIQKKTRPLTDKQWENLNEVPKFITDVKRANLGMYKGHICTHDYAFTLYRLKIDKEMLKISRLDKTR